MMLLPVLQFVIQTVENNKLQLVFLKAAFCRCILVGCRVDCIHHFSHWSIGLIARRISLTIYIPALIAVLSHYQPKGYICHFIPQEDFTRRSYGILFVYIIAILLGYLIVSLYIFYRSLRSTKVLRIENQVKQVLKGIWVLFIFSLLDISLDVVFAQWLPVIPGLTSLGILLSAAIFVIAIHRDKVLDIVTIAHQDIIDTINYGILVLDDNENIVEVNKMLRPHIDLHIDDRFNMDSFLSKVQDEEVETVLPPNLPNISTREIGSRIYF